MKHCYMCRLPIVSYGNGRTRRHVCKKNICSDCYIKIADYMNSERRTAVRLYFPESTNSGSFGE